MVVNESCFRLRPVTSTWLGNWRGRTASEDSEKADAMLEHMRRVATAKRVDEVVIFIP